MNVFVVVVVVVFADAAAAAVVAATDLGVVRGGSALGIRSLEVLAGLLGDEDLSGASGDLAGGHPGAVLGPDQRQVALGGVGAVFSGLQFALEAAHAG